MLKNLRKLRMQRGISQQQLADVIGVSQQSINKYENHSVEPDIDTMSAMADFFNVSIDYLVGRTESDFSIKQYDITESEIKLITDYRRVGAKEKELIHTLMDYLTSQNS